GCSADHTSARLSRRVLLPMSPAGATGDHRGPGKANSISTARMVTLFHHPFCPHSRFVRLALGEYGIETRLIEERVWERRHDFLTLNPAATTPVLVEEGHPPVPGPAIGAEYPDEMYGPKP